MFGRVAHLLAFLGLIGFFLGVFGLGPRMALMAGIALIVASLVAYFLEEYQLRGRF